LSSRSRLDRHASGATEQLEHLLVPEVDPRLDAELHGPFQERLQQRAVGQEDLIDEVDVGHAACQEVVELLDDQGRGPAAVGVPELLLRAERAVIWASA